MKTSTGRPKGSRNVRPSQKAIDGYYSLLRNAADAGDVNAAGKLIELDIQLRKESFPDQSRGITG